MKILRNVLIALNVCVCMPAQPQPAQAADTVDFFVQWAGSHWLGDLSEDWQKPFYKPFILLGRTIKTCEELMYTLNGAPLGEELTTRGYDQANPSVMGCAHTSVLGRLHPSQSKLFDAGHLLEDLYLHLNAASLPWSLGEISNHPNEVSYAELKAQKPLKDDNYIYLDLHEHTYRIRPILIGALSVDGPEIVYAVFEEDEHSTRKRRTGVVFLVRDRVTGPIKAVPVTLQPLEYAKAPLSIDHVYWGQ